MAADVTLTIAGASDRIAVRLPEGRPATMTTPLFHMIPGGARPVAPYSHAVEADGRVFLTGQIPNHPEDDERPFAPDVGDQTRRVMSVLVSFLGRRWVRWRPAALRSCPMGR